MSSPKNIDIHHIALIALMSAILTAGKMSLSFLPNIEIVTLILIVYTVSLGIKKTIIASWIFSTTEIFIYGLSTWFLGYFIIWPLLIITTKFLQNKVKSEYGYAVIAGIFGLLFGLFFAAIESIFYSYAYGLSYWLRGIPFDIVHGISNFIIVLILFKPLTNVITEQYNKYFK